MADEKILQLVSFEVADELFAVPITKVQEIIRLSSIVAVPQSPEFVEGIINLRGKVIPVVDLKTKFDIKKTEVSSHTRIIVAEINAIIVGLIVDAVGEVFKVHEDEYEAAPSIVSSKKQQFIAEIVKRNDQMFLVLDLDRLLTIDETEVLGTVH